MESTATAFPRDLPRRLKTKLAGPSSVWDLLPRRADLVDVPTYREGVRLFLPLFEGGYTMMSARRGRTLYRLARDVERRGITGALVDCGVWNGGSTALLSAGAPSRDAWAFDSFEGLPEPGPLDGRESWSYAGELQGSEEKVKEAVSRYANPACLHVVKGWFADTLPRAAGDVGSVAVLHADGDWYDSVLVTLETFYPAITPGGYVVIDDYGHWQGARRATDEFRKRHGIRETLVKIDYTGRYWRKVA